TAPPTSMLITPGLSAAGIPPSPRNSVTTGTNSGAPSAGKLSNPARAALRQANRCGGEMSCRRATSATMAPGAYDAAPIRPFASSLQRRRRPGPTCMSTRPRGSELSTIWSTIYTTPSVQDVPHVAVQPGAGNVGAKHRLQSKKSDRRISMAQTGTDGGKPITALTPQVLSTIQSFGSNFLAAAAIGNGQVSAAAIAAPIAREMSKFESGDYNFGGLGTCPWRIRKFSQSGATSESCEMSTSSYRPCRWFTSSCSPSTCLPPLPNSCAQAKYAPSWPNPCC